MRDLYYAAIDGARYLCAAAVWHAWCADLISTLKLPSWAMRLIGDYAYFDDPWVSYQRWTARGYDMSFMMESGDA